MTDIDELDEIIGKDLPEGDYDTIAGYIISRLGYLPKQGEHSEVMFENIRFTVLEVENRRIEKVKVEILPLPDEDDEEEEDSDKKNKNKEKE